MITDFLIGKDNLQEQRDRAQQFARERYSPDQFQPQVDLARERATEGIPEAQESQARRRTVESLFRPADTSIYGGNQARAIAGRQQQNRQAQQGMAQFESNLTQQDIQAQQQGEQQFAQARSQQLQTQAQRDAAIEQAEMQYQAELDNRRRQLGSTVANLAGTVAGSFLGPAGAAAGGAIAGGLAGGGMGAVQGAGAGFSTAFQRQQSEDFINQLSGESEQDQPNVSNLLGDTARSSVQTERSQDLIQPDMSGIGQETNFGQPMQVPQQQQPQQSDSGFSVENLFDVGQYDLRQYQQDVGFEGMTDQPQVQQPEEELSFEEFQRQQGMQAVSQSPTFGGYGQRGEGQRVAEGVEGTGDFLYDFFSAGNRVVGAINPLNAIRDIIRDRQREQYEQYLQNQ